MVVRWRMIVLTVGLMLAVPCAAQAAGLLSGTGYAYDDGNGPDGGAWRGDADLDAEFVLPDPFNPLGPPMMHDWIYGTLEFAVFLAADFEDFLVGNSLTVPTPPVSGLVYAYQLDITDASPGVGEFTVGIDTNDPRGFPSYIPVVGGKLPLDLDDQGTSQLWGFQQDLTYNLVSGETSAILYFTSPNRPEYDTSTLGSGLASPNMSGIPSPGLTPVPEPSTLAFIIAGMITVVYCRRAAKRNGA